MSRDFDYSAYGLQPPAARPSIPDATQSIVEVLDRVLETDPEREALIGRYAR